MSDSYLHADGVPPRSEAVYQQLVVEIATAIRNKDHIDPKMAPKRNIESEAETLIEQSGWLNSSDEPLIRAAATVEWSDTSLDDDLVSWVRLGHSQRGFDQKLEATAKEVMVADIFNQTRRVKYQVN